MPANVPITGTLTMDNLAASLTVHEQLMFQQVTALKVDLIQVRNLVTTVDQPDQLGALAICAKGAQSAGTKLFSTTAYISGVKSAVDVYRL
jgi:hypothetical protein